MQAAGGEHRCGKRQCRGRRLPTVREERDRIDDAADQRHGKPGNGRGPDRVCKRAAAEIEARQRQPREEDEAQRDVVHDLPRRGTKLIAQPLAIAWKNVPETLPRRPPEAPSGAALAIGEIGQRLVRAGIDQLGVVEFMAADDACPAAPSGQSARSVACR